jgi:hypothetical protein
MNHLGRVALFSLVKICVTQFDEYVDTLLDTVDGNRGDVAVDLLQVRATEVNSVDDDEGDAEDDEDGANSDDNSDCEAFDAANPQLVKVDFTLADNTVSNLGGLGPQSGVAEQLYYKHVAVANAAGDTYDLKVTVRGENYMSDSVNRNGQNGHYGIINVDCNTSVDLDFQFIDGKTGQPATLDQVMFSWFDLDKGRLGGGDEEITLWPGYESVYVSTFSEIQQADVECPAGAGGGTCRSFKSSTWGIGKDNPRNPMALTKQQAARTFSVEYKDVSSFSVTLEAHAGFGNRNFLFTGMSQVAYSSVTECCPAQVCGCQDFCAEKTNEEKCGLAKCAGCEECIPTTTTTTVAPATPEETCQDGLTFELSSEKLVENTIGKKKASNGGRMLFKGVLTYEGRSLDLSVTDASGEPSYATQARKRFRPDSRGYTGAYKDAGRIAVDKSGMYMFRFAFLDSQTGEQVKLPLFPFALYDVDGHGESVGTCNAAGAITHNETKLGEYFFDNCYTHVSRAHETNIPRDFESLTARQKKKSVTYVYRNTGSWDVGLNLVRKFKDRYVLFKSSKVLACETADKTRDEAWKGKPKEADA